ncbi:MAG: type I glyceraldehyde-3-phosphate dehydrogenase [Candidatus Zambryskibacteria bacterium RIFCSPLOWO2_02_FULL_51_21]|uniref:Type I glyceraldehyde-3-phosphate dehydrogenase n=1 Tax=Candidatus Zambryskibacteria bacterium RIFCSPHIGHO2_02_FULL_43_37 TaxID=1802749 RepID=A0A1G2TJG0_9BACT|nr:MAG: type I glyceraldehyde-3-phosphate dehydrogenase [Candidatus Zambryskibacteria bacterium RIFCSPHIGHO2_01_FULL_52_18]OHA96761.1 MAG: type I glyceraldehyde-3-phosphate dehydrogenase [Candidatus Zambryskibacteria bacterium RIFCSPHIGHO2_02_FULL_43_37]OHB07454.1 MAG: type I glyceraldehyde-3-phosphate dehydrogenase [Candidatus Zambryskibacteria bacterium RIFCSPLOWO2_01_FULL_52_12]OHB11117.1 MAG: type I glyceraldehyde-3-phosphate dehydrogenase [Candidatus Zambryskibacteria bacterium RIFCSPLOWO2_
MKKVRVAINGFGRIGRAFYKIASKRPEIEIVAVNDLGSKDNLEYLLKHDSVYGTWDGAFDVKFLQEKEPAKLPWKDLDIDVVVESTGFFTTFEKAKVHLDAGAKRVVITAPTRDDAAATVLMGVNDEKLSSCQVSSNASCTTNAASPLIAILDEALGIEKAVLNTAHGYTASQSLVDGPSRKGMREGRAAAINIVPSSTGAAIAVTKAFTKLDGLFDGISMRVPVAAGSLVDVTFIAKRNTSAEEVNGILKKAAEDKRWQGIFAVTEEELVSSDILGSPYGSIADLTLTRVVGGNLVKVLAWYDNEMGYAYTLTDHVIKAGSHI